MSAEDVKESLLTMEDVKERLAIFEGLDALPFHTDGGNAVTFTLPDGWNDELASHVGMTVTTATVEIDGWAFPLTKDAILEATSLVGMPKDLVSRTPGPLIEPILNHWMTNGKKYLQLVHNGVTGLAVTRASVNVMSATGLVERLTEALTDHYGAHDLYADFKLQADMHRVGVRLVMPSIEFKVPSERMEEIGDDFWSPGLALEYSPLGERALSVHGYLFSQWGGTGTIAMDHSVALHRKQRDEQEDETLGWVDEATLLCLSSLETELTALTQMPGVDVGDDLSTVTAEIFAKFKVPADARETVMAYLSDSDDLSGYGVMMSVIRAANAKDLTDAQKGDLLKIGGSLLHALSGICLKCHRM